MENMTRLESLDEDSVQCLFFSSTLGSDRIIWEEKCKCINNLIKSFTADYIWHKEEFQVYFPLDNPKNDIPLHLASVTSFGDNIEDEWLIVHLVLEISKACPELVVQIKDNDGDFLLIEAADYLPSWANPDTTNNRVFIQDGHVHIIPPDVVSTDTELSLQKAVNIITKLSDSTKVTLEIELAILNRIGNYPDKLNANIHKAIVKLPLDIAALLTLQPKLIAHLVGVYCCHDAIDAKFCKNINFANCIMHQVTFTKCLYAMIMHSKPINYTSHLIAADKNKRSIVGLKLACGFHMIMGKASQDKCSSKEFNTFLNNLKRNGYFKENLEGSKDYKKLLEAAKEFYYNFESTLGSHVANEISKVMSSEAFTNVKQSLVSATDEPILCEDSDEWLNINPEQLNELLNNRYGKQGKFNSDEVISSQTVMTQLSNFLKTTSDYEGIESAAEASPEDKTVDFDPNEFVGCIEKMLNQLSTTNDESDANDDLEDFSDGDMDMTGYNEMEDVDREVADKLEQGHQLIHDRESMLFNIKQSMKEEKASSGPSSNLLTSIGIKKTDLLDSDDDDE